jgi:hypothetical protein
VAIDRQQEILDVMEWTPILRQPVNP